MEKKTAEETLRQIAGEHRTALMLATTKAMIIKAMEEHSSLQSEEKDKELLSMTQERDYWYDLRKIESAEKDKEIERLREALKGVVDCWECENLLTDAEVSRAKAAISNHPQALSNQPIESDKDREIEYLKEKKQRVFDLAKGNRNHLKKTIEAKDRRIKELEEALTRVSNCNDLATAHEYAKEKLLTL